MKRADLFHPRVFTNQEWAEGYYKRNAKNIRRVGKRFFRLLDASGFKTGRILDAGCGFGAVAVEIAKGFSDVEIIGIDLGDPLLELARSLALDAGVADRITFLKGDVLDLDFDADAFDVVVNTFMVHVVADPVTMVNEIERVTRPQGRVMITDLRRIWIGWVVKKIKTAFTLEEGMEVIQKSNLRSGTFSKGPFWWDYMAGFS